MQTAGQLYHEKIYFVKHFDDNCLAAFEHDRTYLINYRDALRQGIKFPRICFKCSVSVLINGLSKWQKMGVLSKMQNGTHLKTALAALKAQTEEAVSEERIARFLEDSKCPVIHVFEDVFKMEASPDELEQQVVAKIKSLSQMFDTDRLWNSALMYDRILKTLQVNFFFQENN